MNDYAAGFSAGEHDSWAARPRFAPDRRLDKARQATRPATSSEWGRGYWDAFVPQTEKWAQERKR